MAFSLLSLPVVVTAVYFNSFSTPPRAGDYSSELSLRPQFPHRQLTDNRIAQCDLWPTYLVSFSKNASRFEKQEYARHLTADPSTGKVERIVLDGEIVLLVAAFSPSQLTKWHWDCV